MAKDAELKVDLNIDDLLKKAKEIAPILEKALNVTKDVKGMAQYADETKTAAESLKAAANYKKMLTDKGSLKKAFSTKEIENYENELKDLISLVDKLKENEEKLQKLDITEENKDKRLASLKGAYGAAKRKSGEGTEQEKTYKTAIALLEERKVLEQQIQAELQAHEVAYNKAVSDGKKYSALEKEQLQNISQIRTEFGIVTAEKKQSVQADQASDAQLKQEIDTTKRLTAETEHLGEEKKKAAVATSPLAEPKKVTSEEEVKAAEAKPENFKAIKDAAEETTSTIDILREKVAEALNFDRANAGIGEFVEHLNQLKALDKEVQKAGATKELSNEYTDLRQNITWTKLDIRECEKEFTQAYSTAQQETGATSSKVAILATVFSKVGSAIKSGLSTAVSTVQSVASGVQSAFNSIVSVIKNASSAIKSALKGAIKAFNTLKSAALSIVKGIKSAFNGLGKAIQGVRSHFNGMARESRGNFKHMITNITKYVLGFRSLFFLVRRLRKYIGEGIQNMAKFNSGNNNVNANISKLLQSLTFLKNAWSTAFDPILQFVTPWLTSLIDKLAEVGNALSRFLGSLLGVSSVFQAKKGPAQNYAKSLNSAGNSAGKAAKKQKKLNDRIAEFDDLILLGRDKDPDNGKGTGGGSGAGNKNEQDPNKMFNIIAVSKKIKKAFEDMWATANFTSLGEKVGQAIIKGLEGIKWGKIQATLYKIGKSVATFLNGVFADPKIWTTVGNTLAQAFNSILKLLAGFLENNNTDWGGGFAKIIVSFFDNVDWNTVKKSIDALGKKLVENINSFFANLNAGKIMGKISGLTESITTMLVNLITGIKWTDVINAFAGFGKAILEGLSAGLSGSDNSVLQLVGNFLGAISHAFDNEDPGAIITAISNFLSSVFDKLEFSGILSSIKTFVSGILSSIATEFANSNNPIAQALSTWVSTIQSVLETGDVSLLATGLLNFVAKALSSINWDEVINSVIAIGEKIITGLETGLKNSDNPFLQTIGSLIGTIKNVLTTLWPVIQQVVNAVMPIVNAILPVIQAILPGIATLISNIATLVLPVISSILQIIMPIIQQLVEAILPILNNILVALQPAFAVLTDTILPLISQLLDAIMPLVKSILGLIEAILVPIAQLIAPLLQLVGAILEPLITILKPICATLSIVVDEFSAFLKPVLELLSPLTDLLTDCLSPVASIFGVIGEVIGVVVVPIMKILSAALQMTVIPMVKLLSSSLSVVGTVFKVVADGAKFMFGIMQDGFKALWNVLKPILNSMIGGIEKFANGMIDGINASVKALNKLSFDVPEWVPKIGGKKFGFNLKEVSKISIPRLAQGAVIPPNNEFLAMLGDQKSGTNIEAPLDTIKQAVAEVIANNGNQEMIQLLQQLITVVENKNLVIGDKEIGKANARYNRQQSIVRGTSF